MEKLKIPREHFEKFEYYFGLSKELKSDLISEIKQCELGRTPNSLVEQLSAKLPIPKNRLRDIITILVNLLQAKKGLGLDDNQFAEALKEAFEKSESTLFTPEIITEELRALMHGSGENLIITEKVIEVMTANQKTYLEGSISSDIRPVFSDSEALSEVLGVVLIHQLKIKFRENDNLKELFFSLDGNDLEDLKKAIDIAQRKEEKLGSIVNSSIIDIKS